SAQLFSALNAKQPAQKYEVLSKLAQSYGLAGRWADAIEAIEQAITTVGAQIPVNDLPTLRFLQQDYSVRLDQPDATARYGKAAIEAFPKCGTKCPPAEQQKIVYYTYITGRIFHVLYATAND